MSQETTTTEFDHAVEGGLESFTSKMQTARDRILAKKATLHNTPLLVSDWANDPTQKVDAWKAYHNIENKYLKLMSEGQRDTYLRTMYKTSVDDTPGPDISDYSSAGKQLIPGMTAAASAGAQQSKLTAAKTIIAAREPAQISKAVSTAKTAAKANLEAAAKEVKAAATARNAAKTTVKNVASSFKGTTADALAKRADQLITAQKKLDKAEDAYKAAKNAQDSARAVKAAVPRTVAAKVKAQNLRLLNKVAWKTVGKAAVKGHVATSFATGGVESAIRQGLKLNDDIKSMGGTWKDALSATGSVFTTKRGWKNLGWGLLGSLADTANTMAFGLVGDGEKFRKHIDIDAVPTSPSQISGKVKSTVDRSEMTRRPFPPVLKQEESNTATRNKVPTKASAPLTGERKREYEQKRLLEKRLRERQGLMLLPGEPEVIPMIGRRNPRNVPY